MGDEECTGAGNCHGCLKWCSNCGDVSHVCDARLRGDRCDEHPIPPTVGILKRARIEAERMIAEGQRLDREGRSALQEVVDSEHARRAYDRQIVAEENRLFNEPQRS